MSSHKNNSVIDILQQALDYEMKLGTKMCVNWDMYKEWHREEQIKLIQFIIQKEEIAAYRSISKKTAEYYLNQFINEQ